MFAADRGAGRDVHADDRSILDCVCRGAVTHVGEIKFFPVVDPKRVQDVVAALFRTRVTGAKYETFAVEIVQVANGAGSCQRACQYEVFGVCPECADAAQERLLGAVWAVAAPGPGRKDALQRGELGLVVSHQLDVFA